MEIEEVKKITRYDEYTVNEFVRGLVKARSDIEKANEELSTRADNVSMKADELEAELSEEELVKSEEELQSIKQDKEKIEQTLAKWETEKERIKSKLENKKQENENKINENQQKIQDFENEVKENEEKMQDLDKESEEYAELEKANNEINRKMSRIRGNIKRYEKKINNLIEMIGNLEEENVLEGLKPPREIKSTPHTLTLNEKYKAYIDKKARETGYYSQARTPEENKNFRKMDELAKNLQKEELERVERTRADGEIASLEEQIKKSAARMKEYRETGNYNQEALEHAYYNNLISSMNDLKSKEPEKEQLVETVKEEKTEQEPVKTQQTQAKQPVEIVKKAKTEAKPAKQLTEKAKIEPVEVKQQTKTVKTQTTQAKQPSEAAKIESVHAKQLDEPVKEESKQAKAKPKSEIKWNSKLTQDQIEELIADGIEPGDNEYNLYLWNHGINPFEDQIKQKQPAETVKSVADPVLEKYKNDGFGQNAFGWYFNPWKGEFDKDYDPHNDPEYNEKLKEEKIDKSEKTSGNVKKTDKVEKNQTEEKPTKVSIWQKIKDRVSKIINIIKGYIANFNNKQLPEGTETEQEKAEYVAKANEVLKETLSADRVFDAKSRAAMQGREEFLAGIHISKELKEKIDAQEDVKEEMCEKKEAER